MQFVHQNERYSLVKKLKEEGKLNPDLEVAINRLSLEEIIGVKLELAGKFLLNGRLYGFPLWKTMPRITQDALVRFALSVSQNKVEASRLLGINVRNLYIIMKRMNIEEFQSPE